MKTKYFLPNWDGILLLFQVIIFRTQGHHLLVMGQGIPSTFIILCRASDIATARTYFNVFSARHIKPITSPTTSGSNPSRFYKEVFLLPYLELRILVVEEKL